MLLIALTAAEFAALALGVFGVAGVLLTALRWRRDDTTAVVTQQSTILHDMQAVNTELRETAAALRSERDECKNEVSKLRRELRRDMGEIRDKLDNGP